MPKLVNTDRPTSTSRTCTCGWLRRAAKDPKAPIVFDEELSEYQIQYGADGQMMIYYCPFCGGHVPESKRDSLFSRVSSSEMSRISAIFAQFETVSDVIKALGPPDHDIPDGVKYLEGDKDKATQREVSRRLLVYESLSSTVSVEVDVGSNDRFSLTFSGKYLGKTKPAPDQGHKTN